MGESFFDPKFGGSNWTDELRSHMMAAYRSADGPAAYHEIAAMLADLKDPYTRLLPPDEYRDFVVSANGEMQGVGLLIANEPVEGHLVRGGGWGRRRFGGRVCITRASAGEPGKRRAQEAGSSQPRSHPLLPRPRLVHSSSWRPSRAAPPTGRASSPATS